MSLQVTSTSIETGFNFNIDLNRPYQKEKEEAYEEAPPVEGEVVEWMRQAGAHNRIMSPWKNDFNGAGGNVIAQSNDGWYPGAQTENYQVFRRQRGEDIQSAGFVRVDASDGSKVGETPSLDRGWAGNHNVFAINVTNYGTQHNTLIGEIKKAVPVPFEGQIRTFTIPVENRGFMSAPTVFKYNLLRPALQANFNIQVSSEQAGTMSLTFWNTNREPVETEEVNISQGDQKVTVQTRGDPVVSGGFIEMNFDGFEQSPSIRKVDSFPLSM